MILETAHGAAVITDAEGGERILPGAAADLRRLAEALRTPSPATEVRREFRTSTHDLLELLEGMVVVVDDPLPDHLLSMHRATLLGGDASVTGIADDGYVAGRRSAATRVQPTPHPSMTSTAHTLLTETLQSRRSCRRFAPTQLTLQELVTLLVAGDEHGAGRRSYPSGGALYAVEAIVVPFRVMGLEGGLILRHVPSQNALTKLAVLPSGTGAALLPGVEAPGPAALVLLTLDLARPSAARYAGQGYRLALLEAGHFAQSLMLIAAAAGIGTLALGALDEQALTSAGVLSHYYEVLLYAIGVGWPADHI